MKLNNTVKIIPGYSGLKKSCRKSQYVCTQKRGCIFSRREFEANFNVEVGDCETCEFSGRTKAKDVEGCLEMASHEAVGYDDESDESF